MYETEEKKYDSLNKLAECGGIVILGGDSDKNIPLCELKQAFSLETPFYNRSFSHLSIGHAAELYDRCIASLEPDAVLLHIGEEDLEFFRERPSAFDAKYRALISHIKAQTPRCQITIICLKNPDGSELIADMNQHLKYISQSEQCEFGDIGAKRVWNPKSTKETMSFLYSLGFVRPLKNRRQVYDLIRILFCYEQPCA